MQESNLDSIKRVLKEEFNNVIHFYCCGRVLETTVKEVFSRKGKDDFYIKCGHCKIVDVILDRKNDEEELAKTLGKCVILKGHSYKAEQPKPYLTLSVVPANCEEYYSIIKK